MIKVTFLVDVLDSNGNLIFFFKSSNTGKKNSTIFNGLTMSLSWECHLLMPQTVVICDIGKMSNALWMGASTLKPTGLENSFGLNFRNVKEKYML